MAEDIGDLAALEALPDNHTERRDHLRLIADGSDALLDHCPECARPLDDMDSRAGHAAYHWPPNITLSRMSPLALRREGAVYRGSGFAPPARR